MKTGIFILIWDFLDHILTHLCLASNKRDIGKQCRPRSDATERSVWSWSTLFALSTEIAIKHILSNINHTTVLLEMDRSKQESPLGINRLNSMHLYMPVKGHFLTIRDNYYECMINFSVLPYLLDGFYFIRMEITLWFKSKALQNMQLNSDKPNRMHMSRNVRKVPVSKMRQWRL